MKRELYETFKKVQTYHWWYQGRAKIILAMIDKYSNKINNKTAKVLEIGCGEGSMLEKLERYGKVYGVEYDKEAVDYCKQNLMKNVEQGMLPYNIPYNEKYDIIGCFDVLEHVEEDIESLKTIKSYLANKNSKVYITVPAYKFMWGENDELSLHKRRYTRKELCKKAESIGLKVVKCSYFNTFLFPICFIVRKVRKVVGIKTPDLEVNKKDNWINKLLCWIFSCESKIIEKVNFPFGVSILLVAKN